MPKCESLLKKIWMVIIKPERNQHTRKKTLQMYKGKAQRVFYKTSILENLGYFITEIIKKIIEYFYYLRGC